MNQKFSHYSTDCTGKFVKSGHFIRKSDHKSIQRFKCNKCKIQTSNAVLSPCYRQKKRFMNSQIYKLLCSCVSQRRIAKISGVARQTVYRKFEFLAAQSEILHNQYLESLKNQKESEVFLDEMEDKIHTKCKPVSIALVVSKDRKILLHNISSIRPKNTKLNLLSKIKYPSWKDQSRNAFKELIFNLKEITEETILIKSDQKIMYQDVIFEILPHSTHKTYKSRKAVIAGQGELKKGGRDPLFPLNHTCAMLRANINRLVRRTWCTSKKIESLYKHIQIYIHFHNTALI